MGRRSVLAAATAGWNQRLRKGRDVVAAFDRANLADALPVHLVDPHNVMHRNESTPHAGEFTLQPFLGWIDQHARPLAEDEFLDFDETVQFALINAARVQFVQLALVDEQNAVDALRDLGHCNRVTVVDRGQSNPV